MPLQIYQPALESYARSSAHYAHVARVGQAASTDLAAPYVVTATQGGTGAMVRIRDVLIGHDRDLLRWIGVGTPLVRSNDYERAAMVALANVNANRHVDVEAWAQAIARDVATATD
jgi:hypothetical protein